MYRTILVAKNLRDGQRVLEALRAKSGIDIVAAFWFYFEEETQWRLVIVSPQVSSQGPTKIYTMLNLLLYDLSIDPTDPIDITLDQIRLVAPTSLLYQQVKQGAGLRVASGSTRDVIGEDLYIYWI